MLLRCRLGLGLLLALLAGCANPLAGRPASNSLVINGMPFPTEQAAVASLKIAFARDLGQITPVTPRLGGSLLIVLPTHEALLGALPVLAKAPRLNAAATQFLADAAEVALDTNAQSIDRARIFDSVTIIRTATPDQQPAGAFDYTLWVGVRPETALKWFLSRGVGPSQPIEMPAPVVNGVLRLNIFDVAVMNAASAAGAPIARQALPTVARLSSSGTGFFINATGSMLTANHVVDGCKKMEVMLADGVVEPATLEAADAANDLAVIKVAAQPGPVAPFRSGAPIRQGEAIIIYGFPLAGVLSSEGNLSTGIVSALSGMKDDSRYMQVSAPVQQGNSGGPVFDQSVEVVAIATSKLNAVGVAMMTNDITQNVNFAVKSTIAETFLQTNGIPYTAAASRAPLAIVDISDRARAFTHMIRCDR